MVDLKELFKKAKLRSQTKSDYIYILSRFKNLDDVDRINEFISSLPESTGALAISAIKKYFILTNQEDKINKIKMVTHRSPEKIMFLESPQKIKMMLGVCRNNVEWMVVKLILETGIRRSIVIEIKPEDILTEGNIIVRKSYKGNKTKEDYLTVSITDDLRDKIFDYVRTNNIGKKQPIFLNYFRDLEEFKASPEHKITLIVLKLAKLVGLDMSPHGLRHTFGTFYYAGTKDIVATARALGQRDIQSTMRYINYSNALSKENIEKVREMMFK